MRLRDYVEENRAACLAVFDSNVPDFFGLQERRFFEAYLSEFRGPYLVIEDRSEIVGCGGTALHESDSEAAVLCWGMVLRRRHGMGFGKLLLFERLLRLSKNDGLKVAVLNTSQFCAGFFAKMGFETSQVLAGGYFPGMDKYEMKVRLPYQPPAAYKAEAERLMLARY